MGMAGSDVGAGMVKRAVLYPRLVEMLRKLEWEPNEYAGICPVCSAWEKCPHTGAYFAPEGHPCPIGHEANCELRKLLDEVDA